jgi:Flp pilus assembly protein TadD
LRAAALALVALCASGCAGPSIHRSALDRWQVVETVGVRIVADAPPRELDALARDLAGFDAAFSFLIGRKLAASGPTTFVLIRDPELAGRFGLGRGVAGFAETNLDGSFACVLLRSNAVATRIVLFHEYTHLLLARQRSAPLPRWYNEGLAEYFSTVAFRDGALVVGAIPAERLVWLVERRHPMPLDRLFGGDADSTLRGESIHDFYATAWALSHYLMGSERGRRELSRFDRELSSGAALDAAREAAFARPFDGLEKELATHIDYLARGVAAEMVLDPRKVRVVEPSPAIPMRRNEAAGVLGSLALAGTEESEEVRRYASLAEALLAVEVEEDPANPRARAALARARALGGDSAGAEEVLAAALADAPEDERVQLDAGRAALAADAWDLAESRFRRVLALDERSAPGWFGLGSALAHKDQPEPARAALERARSLGWSAALDLELGRLHVEAHRAAEARALLQPLAGDPHGGSIAEEAAELLRKLDAPDEDQR